MDGLIRGAEAGTVNWQSDEAGPLPGAPRVDPPGEVVLAGAALMSMASDQESASILADAADVGTAPAPSLHDPTTSTPARLNPRLTR